MKALMIHGAQQLRGAGTPNNASGWGRVDLKNTLGAQYAVFDDHAQGLATGNVVEYTVQVAGATDEGILIAGGPPAGGSAETLTFAAVQPVSQAAPPQAARAGGRVEPVPGFDRIASSAPIRVGGAGAKADLAPVEGRIAPAARPGALHDAPRADLTLDSTLINVIAGGDFEDPDTWEIWLGYGVPLFTDGSDGGVVLDGDYSLWLGGSPSDDSVWYPVSFPETIDDSRTSFLEFEYLTTNLDQGFDRFCYAVTDSSGYIVGGVIDCTDQANPDPDTPVRIELSDSQTAALAGQTGYLVLYNDGDALQPHMSAFVDNVALAIDYPDPQLEPTPESAPAGATFLLSGSNNLPYGAVDLCSPTCSGPQSVLGTFYADARGDLAVYFYSNNNAAPGVYGFQTADALDRTADTTITIEGASQPTLGAAPGAGPAGTKFTLTGGNFVPNDSQIAVALNGEVLGTTGSDAEGDVAFTIQTSSNTPAGAYTVVATDSAGRSATASFEVTEVPAGNPAMTVDPATGRPGSSFRFSGSGFAPQAQVDFSLDGQAIGQATTDGSGGFVVTLNTNPDIPPATYTLLATQGGARAAAQFEITGGGGPAPSGTGLFVTLVWTDPPAQVNAASTLINNLDLRVVGPGGTFHGNGGAGADTRNNVETVRINNPQPGTYTIRVTATSVNATFGAQPFALVATTAQNFGADNTNVNLGGKVFLPVVRR
jgi:hypothetical protein